MIVPVVDLVLNNEHNCSSNWPAIQARLESLLHGMASPCSTLCRWQRRRRLLKPTPQANGRPSPELFKQVAISEVLGTQWSGEVRLPDGTEVRWRHPAPVAALRELLGYLRDSC